MITYLGLGTNLGDRAANLQAAIRALEGQVRVLRVSSVYETEPWGYTHQPAFLNLVVMGDTELSPGDLLTFLKNIEVELGRQPNFQYGPRLIDLDILLYGESLVDLPALTIPHPRLAERAFVLVPLAELAGELRHPRSGKTIAELLKGVDSSTVKKISSPASSHSA